MERALVYELKKIPELTGGAYPLNAPEGETRPHVVYTRIRTESDKTLEKVGDDFGVDFMFSILTKSYGQMQTLRDQVIEMLQGFLFKTIGPEGHRFYVVDVTINNKPESYETELRMVRGIIDFTIHGRSVL